jgi:hypothetical protein
MRVGVCDKVKATDAHTKTWTITLLADRKPLFVTSRKPSALPSYIVSLSDGSRTMVGSNRFSSCSPCSKFFCFVVRCALQGLAFPFRRVIAKTIYADSNRIKVGAVGRLVPKDIVTTGAAARVRGPHEVLDCYVRVGGSNASAARPRRYTM